MLPTMTIVDHKNEEEIICPLAKKLMHISDDDAEDESNNNLLLADKQLSRSDEDSKNNGGTSTETKDSVPSINNCFKSMVVFKIKKSYVLEENFEPYDYSQITAVKSLTVY